MQRHAHKAALEGAHRLENLPQQAANARFPKVNPEKVKTQFDQVPSAVHSFPVAFLMQALGTLSDFNTKPILMHKLHLYGSSGVAHCSDSDVAPSIFLTILTISGTWLGSDASLLSGSNQTLSSIQLPEQSLSKGTQK